MGSFVDTAKLAQTILWEHIILHRTDLFYLTKLYIQVYSYNCNDPTDTAEQNGRDPKINRRKK